MGTNLEIKRKISFKVARLTLNTRLGIEPGEEVLIVTDEHLEEIRKKFLPWSQ